MPMMPLKACRAQGCAEVSNSKYCAKHEATLGKTERAQVDKARPSSVKRGYGAAWKRLRLIVLRDSPLCIMCQRAGKYTASTEVDHIDGDVRNNSFGNLQTLCRSCHSSKTAREQGSFGNPKKGGVLKKL